MQIIKFDIRNFKGIDHTTINLRDDTPGNVGTLIGLNESGKTTILEALSHFVTEDKDTASLVGTVQKKADLQDLIPKDRKAAFTGRISIKATIAIDKHDVQALSEMFRKKHDLLLDKDNFQKTVTVERAYEFLDSNHEDNHTFWSINFGLKSNRAKKFKIVGNNLEDRSEKDIWLAGIDILKDRIPKIVYFPTFLFDFPDRIYLENGETDINSYYTQVIQDVLDSQGEGLSVQKHITDRISKVRSDHANPSTFFAFFFQKDEKKQVDAVLQKVSNEMSSVIFGSWNQILGKNVTGKRVQVDWMLDPEKENAPYLEVSIVDGQSKYSLSERSLGFRWFFSFLLFTQFRRNRKSDSSTLFLFDEPAANLHSKAQIKLLESFSRIAHGSTYIIYSTHSHYMVNPRWLEKAYIVENRSTDYDNEDEIDAFSVRKTDVKATKYRTFVGSNPSKTTYFQPVLDSLDVAFSPLLRSSKALIVEGKNDYYPLLYFRHLITSATLPEIFPGNGAGDAACLISLFRGWGVQFRIILDDDKAGKQARKKYMDEFLLTEKEVLTLGDISEDFKDMALEGLYGDDVKISVQKAFGSSKITKRHYSLFFQELLASKSIVDLPDTMSNFKKISEWIDIQFAD